MWVSEVGIKSVTLEMVFAVAEKTDVTAAFRLHAYDNGQSMPILVPDLSGSTSRKVGGICCSESS